MATGETGKPADDAVSTQLARLLAFLDQASDAFYLLDSNLHFLDANARALAIVGCRKEDLVGKHIAEVVPDVHTSGRYALHQEVLRTGKPMVIHDHISHPVFGSLHFVLKSFKVGDGLGVIASDITELKRSEAALRKSEEFQRKLVSALPDAVAVTDLQGRVTYASAQTASFLGYDTPDELLGKSAFELIAPEQREAAVQSLQRVLRDGVDRNQRYEVVRKDGSRCPCELSAASILDAQGRPEAFVAILRDITARRHSEDLICAQRDLAVALGNVNGLQEALDICLRWALRVSGLDSGGIYLLVEGTGGFDLCRHVGLSDEFVRHVAKVEPGSPKAQAVLRGQPIFAHYAQLEQPLHPISAREGLKALAVLPFAHESRILGCLNLASHRLAEVPVENRAALEALAAQIGTAIARARAEERLREREEQLRQSQKLESLGTLAGGIAHDFNNLLTGIIGHADILKTQAPADSEAWDDIQGILTAATRAADLTHQLLGFARKGKLRHEPVNVHRVVDDVLAILARALDKHIRIERHTHAERPWVMGDPSQLHQVVMNLAVNAAMAMSGGGVLAIATVNQEPAADGGGPTTAPRGRQLVLRVTDTGEGIDEEIRQRIFEPFFTTRGSGEGTGMGLAVAYGIVANHGGTIEVDSQLGQGSVFTVRLPAAAETEVPAEPAKAKAAARGCGRVLVVDDEELVRTAAARILETLGYIPHLAKDGPTAIEFVERHHASIDLVVLDLAMPGMDGRECYEHLRRIAPRVPVVVVTGYAVEGAPKELLAKGVRGLLQKPFSIESLAQAVAAALTT
jgi:PAS domain S-box-containing protein